MVSADTYKYTIHKTCGKCFTYNIMGGNST